jgi:non-ribosomal peptide synthetase component F
VAQQAYQKRSVMRQMLYSNDKFISLVLKAQVRHKNFVKCMHSLTDVNTFNKNDTVIQMSRCSFDIHVQEMWGTLINGATLVMLHPRGTMDFEYLSGVLERKQITYMHSVPSLLYQFFTYIQEHNNQQATQRLRSLCSSGRCLANVLEYSSRS